MLALSSTGLAQKPYGRIKLELNKNYVVFPAAELPYDDEYFKGLKDAPLRSADLLIVESLLQKAVNEYNTKQLASNKVYSKQRPNQNQQEGIINLHAYKMQLFCVKNEKGEKWVWLNGYYLEGANFGWRTTPLLVFDGGSSCFGMMINVTARSFWDFSINGIG
jgi:hypothetical protein